MNINVFALWFGILIEGFNGTFAFIVQPPQNVAVEIGSSTTLSCTTNGTFFGWNFTAVGASADSILSQSTCSNFHGVPTSDYTFDFNLDAGQCNVTIVSAASRFAGYYLCIEQNNSVQHNMSAVVIVLESGPNCSVSATNTTQVEDSTLIMLNCSVFYNTTDYLRPQLTWRSQGSNTNATNVYANSSITVTDPIPVISSDTCTLNFSQPTNLSIGIATNAPSYSANCSTPVVYPLYCPNRPNITETTSGNATCGTILNCTAAVSNPQANAYEWWLFVDGGDETGRIFKSNETTVAVFENGVYVCNATNGLPGCTNTTAEYTITNVIPTTTLSTRTSRETSAGFWTTSPFVDNTTERCGDWSSNDGLIAVCVCLGVSFTINIIVIVMIVVILRRQRITTQQNRADDQVGSVNRRYSEETAYYQNVAQKISIETTGYEHLNPSIDISPYQELADRNTI